MALNEHFGTLFTDGDCVAKRIRDDIAPKAAGVGTCQHVFGEPPFVGRWVFSTNGVAVMGMHGIPCIGFGPGNEIFAHMATEQIPVDHLVKAAAWYAAFPGEYTAGR